MGLRTRRIIFKIVLYVVLPIFVFWILFPFVWVFSSSFMNIKELGAIPPNWIPKEPTLKNYRSVLQGKFSATEETGHQIGVYEGARPVLPAMGNSFYIAFIVAFYNTIVGGLAAYSMSRFRTRVNRSLYLTFLGSRVLPPMAMIIPFFIFFRRLSLIGTPWALILSYNLFILPLSIWLLKAYFDRVPADLEEMGLIDGLNRLGALFRIVIPIAIPGFVAVFIMSMLECWSEFFYALVLTDQLTMPPVLIGFRQIEQILWNQMAAAAVLTVLPPVIFVLLLQKYIISGLTAGAVKG
jgi:ABC-type glycerol-3-phosphate transport system permease component